MRMEPAENRFEATPSDTEPGMNLISVDFDLVMVNRRNERLYGKPIVALLGKKCYREFEKRDEPCPHCPGTLALATGEAHETETVGLRDDGTRFFARIRAVPVAGPQGQPTGFIEVVEDITEQKRAESLSCIYADLRAALPLTHSVRKALRESFEAAMRVEGIDMGCIFSVDPDTGEHTLVYQRNVPPSCLASLTEISRRGPDASGPDVPPAETDGAPRSIEVVPVLHRGDIVATLVMGTSTYPDIPATLRAGLQSLGAAASNSVSRIWAEQSRGDAVADLEALIAVNPVPTWVLGPQGRVTIWNKAAERVFGWKAAEVVGRPSPVRTGLERERAMANPPAPPAEAMLSAKDGSHVHVRLVLAPFRDIVGDASTVIIMAEDLTTQNRLADAETRLSMLETPCDQTAERADETGCGARVLIVDASSSWGPQLARILCGLGCHPTSIASMTEVGDVLKAAETEGRPFALAVVDLVPPSRSGGLEQTAVLRGLGLEAPVVVSSDADVRGHEQHGIAAVIKRPYDAADVARVLREVLTDQD